MLMEETPPGVGAQTLALAVAASAACSVAVEDKATAKRARKRSRYLADYEIPTILNGLHGDGGDDDDDDRIVTPPPPPRKGAASEGPALLLRLQAPDLLAALHRCAASPYDYEPLEGVDAGALLRFFALHREASASVSASVAATHRAGKDTALVATGQHRSNDAPAAAAARPNPCQAMAVGGGSAGNQQAGGIAIGHAAYAQAHHHIGVGPANAAAAPFQEAGAGPSKRRRNKKVAFALGAPTAAGCSAQPPTHGVGAGAMAYPAYAQAHHAGPSNAAALGGPGPNKKKVTFALGAPASAADAGCSAQLAATHSSGIGGAGSAPNKPAKNKKAVNGQQHFSKPVALILQFAPGTAADQLPSKEQLHSTLRGFGPLIEPSTEITRKQARVVFQSSAAAEAAYSHVHTLGAFASARLQYLRPPPPPPKIPLTDVRKNLERMIASLTGPSLLGKEDSAWSLAGEMQHLLVKVDRALNSGGAGPSTSVAAHHH